MDSPIYLAYRLSVGKNLATFALYTEYVGKDAEGAERRIASLLDPGKVTQVLEQLDFAAIVIQNWRDFYHWLSREGPWGAFTEEIGNRLVPHWVSKSAEYSCTRLSDQVVAFIERDCILPSTALKGIKLEGVSPEPVAARYVSLFQSNLMVTTQPLFLGHSE